MQNDDRSDYREAYERCGVPRGARTYEAYFMELGPTGRVLYPIPREINWAGDGFTLPITDNGYAQIGSEMTVILDWLYEQSKKGFSLQEAAGFISRLTIQLETDIIESS